MEKEFWTEQKQKLGEKLTRKIVGDKSAFQFADLKATKLPELMRISLQNQAQAIFKQEKPIRIVPSDKFNFSDPNLKSELVRLRDLLLDQVCFTPAEVKKAINLCITLQLDLFVRPFRTLLSILGKNQKSIQRKNAIQILRGLDGASPAIERLISSLKIHHDTALNLQEFTALIGKLKAEIYQDHPVSAVVADLRQLIGFYLEVDEKAPPTMHAAIVHEMLEDRGLEDFSRAFAEEKNRRQAWSVEDVQQFLEHYLLIGQLARKPELSDGMDYVAHSNGKVSEPEPAGPGRQQRRNGVGVKLSFETNGSGHGTASGKEKGTRFEINENGVSPREEAMLRQSEEPLGRSFRAQKEFDGTSTDIINREQIEYQPPGPYPSLSLLIDKKSRDLFVKKIFKKDESAYAVFIDHVEKKESWKEAKAILDAELADRKISPFSRDAVKLSDLLFARYFSRGKF